MPDRPRDEPFGRPEPPSTRPPTPAVCSEPFPDPPADTAEPVDHFEWMADLINRLSIAWNREVRQLDDLDPVEGPTSLPVEVKIGVAKFFPVAADTVMQHGSTLGWSESKRDALANLLRDSADQAAETLSDDESMALASWSWISECEIDIESLKQARYDLLNAIARGASAPNADGDGEAADSGGSEVEPTKPEKPQAEQDVRSDPHRIVGAADETTSKLPVCGSFKEAEQAVGKTWATYRQLSKLTGLTESAIRGRLGRARNRKDLSNKLIENDERAIPESTAGTARNEVRIAAVWPYLTNGTKRSPR